MDVHLPEITISAHDLSRLDVLTGVIVAHRTPTQNVLARELRRARVVASDLVWRGTVTMHSIMRYRDGDSEQICTVTLVYPGEEDAAAGKISVLTPIGCALIGLSEGQSIRYDDADEESRTLTVLKVFSQARSSADEWRHPQHKNLN
jgi:regulator of nucleoside diphosphate kinase